MNSTQYASPGTSSNPGPSSASLVERDPTWICVFCKEPPHSDELGDLFGPYYVPKDGVSKSNAGRKGKNTGDFVQPDLGKNNQSPTKNSQEIWFHQDCICWSSGVYLLGNTIKNMDEVVRDSRSCVSLLFLSVLCHQLIVCSAMFKL